jgi:hypothetical protein
MEFWEGAILVVGGLWLVGRMSRASASMPPVLSKAAAGTVTPTGNTTATNTDGSSVLVAGEPLSGSAPALVASNQPIIQNSYMPAIKTPLTPVGSSFPTKTAPITLFGGTKIQNITQTRSEAIRQIDL